jgi:hypothetical protein
MKRLRWFELELPFSIRTFGNKLKARPFTNETDDGFLVERVRDTQIEARYIERLPVTESTLDPFGNEHVYERVEYRQTSFSISDEYPQMELTNPPRATQGFNSRLAEIGNFSLTISPIEADVMSWADELSKVFPDRFIVDAIQASGLIVEQNVTARVILSGTVDVRGSLKRFTKGGSSGLDRLQSRFGIGHEDVRLILTSDGSAKIVTEGSQEIIPAVRSALAASR